VVDGTGSAAWIERDVPVFDAVAVSMGLLGIVTKVRLQLNRTFVVDGDEVTTTTGPDGPIDLFGPGTAATPSIRQFLTTTDYSRVLSWPQQVHRVSGIAAFALSQGLERLSGPRSRTKLPRLLLAQPLHGQHRRRHPARHGVHGDLDSDQLHRAGYDSAARHVSTGRNGRDRLLLHRGLRGRPQHRLAQRERLTAPVVRRDD